MRLIFCGSGGFGVPALFALKNAGHEIVQVLTQPDRPAGRGRKLTPTPVGDAAEKMGLIAIRTADINRETLVPADLMVVIAFGQKIGEPAVHWPTLGSINLHASRLPHYRGAAPINWAIIRGETVTGNSVIRLASKMDAGAVLGMSEVAIGDTETAGELHDRLSLDGAPLVLSVVDQLERKTSIEVIQDERAATLAPKLSRGQAVIDFTGSAEVACRLVRGLYPWPGCRVQLLDSENRVIARLRVVRAVPVTGHARLPPGSISPEGLIAMGAGFMRIIDVHPEGKGPMSLVDYRRGNQWEPGMHLKSLGHD